MLRCIVRSSAIREYTYDPETLILGVEFKDGSVYHYADQTPETWEFLTCDPLNQVGQRFNLVRNDLTPHALQLK